MIKVNGKEVEFETFPNGETKLIEDSVEFDMSVIFQRVELKYQNDLDLIRLMFVKNYIHSVIGHKLGATLTITYMPYSRMDRSEDGSAFTLKYVADFINFLNFDKVGIIEPHSDVTPALIDNSQPIFINFDLLPKVMEEVGFDKEEDFIVFPDAGASKRYHNMKGINHVLIGHKHRDFKTGEITSFDLVGKYEGMGDKAIIVDDLSSYGGTFVHTAKALRAEGFKEVYLLVAHAEYNVFHGQLFDHVDKVFTTDSIISVKNESEQLKIYEIGEIL